MLEQLLGLVTDNAQTAVVNNPAIPNEKNQEVIKTLTESIQGSLQQEAQAGKVDSLLGVLSGVAGKGGNLLNNPIVASIASNAVAMLGQKFGIDASTAQGIVSSVLPGVLDSVISKVNDPSDKGMDFNGILGGLLGGKASGIDFNQIGGALADGKLDINDLQKVAGSLLGGGSGNPQQTEGDSSKGLGGLLGGLLGNK